MNSIVASKQIGDLSYMVADLETLYSIVRSQSIRQSKSMEVDLRHGRKSHYVSLSRNLTAAALRNNKRWRYGVVLDGTKLSNRYHVEPYSFAGVQQLSGKKFAIKELVLYDDGSAKLRVVNWPPIDISTNVFYYLENQILSFPDMNQLHRLKIQDGGQRRINGRKIVKKYTYDVKHGDGGYILSDLASHPEFIRHLFTKGSMTNEFEECIWSNDPYVDISGCIKGLVLPKKEIPDFDNSQDKLVVAIRDMLDSMLDNYDVVYY